MGDMTDTAISRKSPKALTIPGFHEVMEKFIKDQLGPGFLGTILDAGAGEGAFSARLKNLGLNVVACDLTPEQFCLEKVECRQADLSQLIPWQDNALDAILFLEVTEHVDNILHLFKEANRVLKPGGQLFLSTPNILSFKSRFRFFFSGYFYSFSPVFDSGINALNSHITPFTLDQYYFRLVEAGFQCETITTDKWQKSSFFACIFYPLIWLYSKLKVKNQKSLQYQNSLNMLLGRKLMIAARKFAV